MNERVLTAYRRLGPALLARGLVMMALLLVAGYTINRFDFASLFNGLADGEAGQNGSTNSLVIYVVAAIGFTAFGGPRQIVSFFGAYLFGLYAGFLLAIGATLGGCFVCYLFARHFGGAIRPFLSGRIDIAVQVWAENAFSMTLILRLLPVGSNLITNLAAGISRVPPLSFFIGSAIGYVPQTLVFVMLGAGVTVQSQWQIALSIVLFAISLAIGLWVYAHHRRQVKRDLL